MGLSVTEAPDLLGVFLGVECFAHSALCPLFPLVQRLPVGPGPCGAHIDGGEGQEFISDITRAQLAITEHAPTENQVLCEKLWVAG